MSSLLSNLESFNDGMMYVEDMYERIVEATMIRYIFHPFT